jgi:hypothetical protein
MPAFQTVIRLCPAIATHCSLDTATMRLSVFAAITRSELIATFAWLTRIRMEGGTANPHGTLQDLTDLGPPFERRSP